MNKFLTTGSMETVSRPSTNTFSDHSISIIHVHKYHNPVNNQNPVSKKIQDTDINRLNNSTITNTIIVTILSIITEKPLHLKRLISCKKYSNVGCVTFRF